MLLKSLMLIVALVSSVAVADKEVVNKEAKATKVKVVDLKTSESRPEFVKDIKKITVQSAQDRIDSIVDSLEEKSDIYEAPTSNYEAGAPASTGNLYYYYYPVAAYPVHANEKVSSSSSSGSSSLLESPLIFLLIPLVLLLIAAPLVAIFVNNNNARSFGRSSVMDEKFGSFADLQEAIDYQLAKYMTALDSDDCMDRIVCELGVKASNIPHKNLFFSVVEWLAPDHGLLGYGRMTILKQAATGKFTMESCKKYTCNPPASIQPKVSYN